MPLPRHWLVEQACEETTVAGEPSKVFATARFQLFWNGLFYFMEAFPNLELPRRRCHSGGLTLRLIGGRAIGIIQI